ncbi:deoxynucleoside kinase [Nanoarchaeota archaeon]
MANKVTIITGNIGSGKSTLADYIGKQGDFLCIPEFIDKAWRDHFYEDRKGMTAYFEKSCLMGRIARHVTAKKTKGTVFFDRGLIEAREIFVQNSFDEGYMTHEELSGYDLELKRGLDKLGRTKGDLDKWMESTIVYLEAPPEVCYQRQFKRNKTKDETGGEKIPREYFQRINSYYKKLMTSEGLKKAYNKWGLSNTPGLVTINASRDFTKNGNELDEDYLKETFDRFRGIIGEQK